MPIRRHIPTRALYRSIRARCFSFSARTVCSSFSSSRTFLRRAWVSSAQKEVRHFGTYVPWLQLPLAIRLLHPGPYLLRPCSILFLEEGRTGVAGTPPCHLGTVWAPMGLKGRMQVASRGTMRSKR